MNTKIEKSQILGGDEIITRKLDLDINFTENRQHYLNSGSDYFTTGSINLDDTDAEEGKFSSVFISGYYPNITGSNYIIAGDTSNGQKDVYTFQKDFDSIKLYITGLSVLTTPIVTLTPADEEIDISWTISVGATSYTVLRNTTNSMVGATNIYTGPLLTFNDTSLTNGTDYYYFIQATGRDGFIDSDFGTNNDQPEEYPSDAFVFTIQTDNTGVSTDLQFVIPTFENNGVISSEYNCTVDRGDGTSFTATTHDDSNWTLNYASAGEYRVIITGIFKGLRFANGGDKSKIKNIEQWGSFDFGNYNGVSGYFYGCDNLTITATDSPTTSTTIGWQQTFQGCSSLTSVPTITSWNFDVAETFTSFFRSCILFNQNLDNMNVSNVNTFNSMFRDCDIFNGSFLNWITSLGTNFSNFLAGCHLFNQPVAHLDLGLATTILGFADGATIFNQPVDNMDLSSCLSFAFAFRNTSMDQSFATWDVRSGTSTAVGFLDNTNISTTNYDATLIGWDSRTPYNTIPWDFAGATYTLGGAAETARTNLIGKGITFTDGGGI